MTESADAPLNGRHVLIVEDDYFIASDLAEALQDFGAVILGPTSTVDDALHVISGAEPETAVLDINLGQEKVYPLADALLARGVPFIFATGYSGDVLPARYEHIPRCQKPVQAVLVAKLLAQQLD
jgi:CheY-like chemotaxis protein